MPKHKPVDGVNLLPYVIIHQRGHRSYFETFGMADIEQNRPMIDDEIFWLMR